MFLKWDQGNGTLMKEDPAPRCYISGDYKGISGLIFCFEGDWGDKRFQRRLLTNKNKEHEGE